MTPEERLALLAQQVNSANDLEEVYQRLGGILEQQNKSISGFLNAQREVVRLSRQESLIEKTRKQIKDELEVLDVVDDVDTISELEEELEELESKVDVYYMVPLGTHYNMTTFECLKDDLYGREYMVGDEDNTRRSAEEATESLIDDIGYEVFTQKYVDGIFYMTKSLHREVKDWFASNEVPVLKSSSGIGKFLSEKMYRAKFNMYGISPSLIGHGDHESIQFGERRKQVPLIAKI
jgi:hypothetical protein